MGTSPSPTVMTGTTCHRLGIMRPWWQVALFLELLAVDFEKQAAVAAVGAVTLLGFQESFLAQIVERTAYSGLGQLQLSGDCWDSRPAFAVLVGSVGQVDVNRDRTVGKIRAVQEIKLAHQTSPLVSYEAAFCDREERDLRCLWLSACREYEGYAAGVHGVPQGHDPGHLRSHCHQ